MLTSPQDDAWQSEGPGKSTPCSSQGPLTPAPPHRQHHSRQGYILEDSDRKLRGMLSKRVHVHVCCGLPLSLAYLLKQGLLPRVGSSRSSLREELSSCSCQLELCWRAVVRAVLARAPGSLRLCEVVKEVMAKDKAAPCVLHSTRRELNRAERTHLEQQQASTLRMKARLGRVAPAKSCSCASAWKAASSTVGQVYVSVRACREKGLGSVSSAASQVTTPWLPSISGLRRRCGCEAARGDPAGPASSPRTSARPAWPARQNDEQPA